MLFRRRQRQPTQSVPVAAPDEIVEVEDSADFGVEVRGESFHMADVLAAAREVPHNVSGDRMQSKIRVRLRREPENPHDANAIVVLSNGGKELGHIAHETAAEYAPVLDGIPGLSELECGACIWGRRIDGVGWRAGVWLALPPPSTIAKDAPGR